MKGIRLETQIYIKRENEIMQGRVSLSCWSPGSASGTDDLLLLGADFGESQRKVIKQELVHLHFVTSSNQTAAWKEPPETRSPGLGKGRCSLSWCLAVNIQASPGCSPTPHSYPGGWSLPVSPWR